MKNIIRIFCIGLIILAASSLQAVFDDYEPSARARALGGAFYTISNDADGIYYNPAGLALATPQIKTGYTKVFSNDFQVVQNLSIVMDFPKKWGNIAIAMQTMDCDYEDVEILSEKTYYLAHAFTLLKDVHSEVHVGYSASIYHLAIDKFGDQSTFGLNIGALAILHKRTRLAFAFSNLNNPKIGKDSNHDLPQKMTVGVLYMPYEGITTSFELKKTLNGAAETNDTPTEYHGGIEVVVLKHLTLRSGLRSNPASFSAGFGINIPTSKMGIIVDYGFNTHAVLDNTHHIGLGFKF